MIVIGHTFYYLLSKDSVDLHTIPPYNYQLYRALSSAIQTIITVKYTSLIWYITGNFKKTYCSVHIVVKIVFYI